MPDFRDPVALGVTDPAPLVAAPPPFVDRRVAFRRAADRLVHEETRLLARSLDILAAEDGADARLGRILRLLAEALGAPRAALLGDRPVRRVAVVVDEGEDPEAADALAAWLDAGGPRSRAQRAAAGPAPVVRIVARRGTAGPSAGERGETHRLLLALPSAGGLLGFDLAAPLGEAELEQRLPAPLLRHAAAILAVVSRDLALERELELLRAREAERSRFVSTVAHELRTPLTGLGGYLDLILDDKVDDPAVEREFLERGRGIVSSIASLVGDLLELSRLDSGSLRLELAPFSMAELGSRVIGALQPIAMDRGIALEAELPPRMRMALGDRRRIEQILTNLVGNALKFVAPGGRVKLAAWTDGAVALFAVRDDGAGIGPDDRARIFERFQRLAAHEGVTGTGLGLPIARDLARAMGGELDVASVPGSGSSFVVVLPGPAGASPDDVDAVVARVLPAEELALEERAVLRALELAGRDVPAVLRPVPPLEPMTSVDDVPAPIEPTLRPARPAATRRRPRLRALDGGVGRAPTRPSPA
jgi:signal transduction histidine kinase